MASLLSLTLVVALTTVSDVKVLFFTSQHCPPCQQAKPVVQQLVGQGYPIETVNTDRDFRLAQQYGITSVPTYLLVVRGEVVDRASGPQSAVNLTRWIESAGGGRSATAGGAIPGNYQQATGIAQGAVGNASSVSSGRNTGIEQRGSSRDSNVALVSNTAEQASGTAGVDPRQVALAASVRLTVDERNSKAFGTGTIIHRNGEDALILTCGHLFREAGQRAGVDVELGFPNPVVVPGQVFFYDADAHDIAFVVAKVGSRPVTVARLAPHSERVQVGQPIFSVGCSNGSTPSVMNTRVKALTTYSNVEKYDAFTRPEQGRSGGGLFLADGRLIGVCNSAAVEIDEGIYAGLDSIYYGLRTKRLESMVRPDVLADQRVAARDSSPAGPTITAPDFSRGKMREGGSSTFPSVTGEVPGRPQVELTSAAGASGPLELIVVVRSKDDPSQTMTYVIENPTLEQIQALGAGSQLQEANPSSTSRLQPPPAVRSEQQWHNIPSDFDRVRAQSPE